MNRMIVNPWLSVSPDGPLSIVSEDLIHLRQGEMDGACGPYSLAMALISLGALSRDDAVNLDGFDGRTREGKFREKLREFGGLVSRGTTESDLGGLADSFKGVGIGWEVLDVARRRKTAVREIAEVVDSFAVPIMGVNWEEGDGHWVLVVGYQGFQLEEADELQVTHLLCLDPGSEAPKTSLWNAVIEVFDDQGEPVNEGRFYARHWGSDGLETACRIDSSVIISRDPGHL